MMIVKLTVILFFCCIIFAFLALILREAIKKNIHIWLPSYLIQCIKRKPLKNYPIHIIFAIVDHFEPIWNKPSTEQEKERVDAWVNGYPETVKNHTDSDGKYPQHTWFYPYDEYVGWHLEKLKNLCSAGYGDIELHLHHDNDTSNRLREKIDNAKQTFSKHGLLVTEDENNRNVYGFIHGNWSLDNSRRDGRWCGVNNELQILAETGCYADFTMPSAPSETQSRKINSIYYAIDNPNKPKSYNTGKDVKVGKKSCGDLMMIQGPLCLNWKKRKAYIFPSIENGDITSINPPIEHRIDLWIKQHIHVHGRPDWVFVKVYTHGAQDKNYKALLGHNGYLDRMYSYLESTYNDGIKYKLHYVTTREMYNLVKASEAGEYGDPNIYRNYVIPPRKV